MTPKSSKSLDHLSIETHGFGNAPQKKNIDYFHSIDHVDEYFI